MKTFVFRFDIIFFNYERLHCFINNFNKIKNFNSTLDRVICVSSTSHKKYKQERTQFINFCKKNNITNYRYLHRKNFGIDQMARIDYFSCRIGGKQNYNSSYIFQMQEHYLAIDDPVSILRVGNKNLVKEDVSPDGLIFDLNEIEKLFIQNKLQTLFADRGNPLRYSIAKYSFIAPNGGNFFLRTSVLPELKKKILRLSNTCDNTYDWALFMEYYWGELFFQEGNLTYDYFNKILLSKYTGEDYSFKVGIEDYYCLRNKYLSAPFYPEYYYKPLKDRFLSCYNKLPVLLQKIIKFFYFATNKTINKL